MIRKSNLLISGLVIVVIGAGTTFAIAQYGTGWRGHHDMRGHMGFRLDMFCGDSTLVDRLLSHLEDRVKPTDVQKAVFADFKTAAKAAADKIKSACPIERPRNVPERFAMAEKRVEATLEAVRTIRPAADKLYAALSDEQKAQMNGLRRGRIPHMMDRPTAAPAPN
jgi:LTXXQ motif family protein